MSRPLLTPRTLTATLLLAATAWAGPASTGATPATASGSRDASDTFEAQVVHWTNVQRRAHGVPALRASSCVDRFAEAWARRLAGTTSFYHQGLAPVLRTCGGRVVGENIALGNRTARGTVAAWMRSPGHRRNLLNPAFSRIGVGAAWSSGGRLYTVQDLTG